MTTKTPLQRLDEAIIKDPNGKAAKQAADWLAINVMGWLYKSIEHLDWPNTFDEPYFYVVLTEETEYQIAGEEDIQVFEAEWNPFTDMNHRYELVRKAGAKRATNGAYAIVHRSPWAKGCSNHKSTISWSHLDFYSDDKTHDARMVLHKCHADGELSDEEIEKWLK